MSHFTLPWIIDSSASDYMIGQSNLFSSYIPYTGPDKVQIVDDTFSSISGKVWCISHILFPCSLFYMSLILLQIFYLLVVSHVI